MKVDIEDLELGRRPCKMSPQAFTGKRIRRVKTETGTYKVAVAGGTKSIWIKSIHKDWVTVDIDDLVIALESIIRDQPFTPHEDWRTGKEQGVYVDK